MARIRTLKPEIWESEKLGRLSALARLNFIGLISLADDQGRGRGDAAFLMARLHAYAPDVGSKDMKRALGELQSVGSVVFYRVQGCSYYHLPNWTSHQKIDKPSPSRLPSPLEDGPNLGEDSASPRGTVGEHSLLDLGPRTRDQVSGTAGEGFENFWEVYPRKQAKQDALKAWKKLEPDESLRATILAAVEVQRQSPDWKKDGGKWIPFPATWINGRRWEDQVGTAISPNGGQYGALIEH